MQVLLQTNKCTRTWPGLNFENSLWSACHSARLFRAHLTRLYRHSASFQRFHQGKEVASHFHDNQREYHTFRKLKPVSVHPSTTETSQTTPFVSLRSEDRTFNRSLKTNTHQKVLGHICLVKNYEWRTREKSQIKVQRHISPRKRVRKVFKMKCPLTCFLLRFRLYICFKALIIPCAYP